LAHVPETRRDFWTQKFERNKARDERDLKRAAEEGWESVVIWECETKDQITLSARLKAFLGPQKKPPEI
jgi:DNA mismatch endonuclease (patch repair protein)